MLAASVVCTVVHRLHTPQVESSERTFETVAEGDGGPSEGDA